jgi:hypothetical protein
MITGHNEEQDQPLENNRQQEAQETAQTSRKQTNENQREAGQSSGRVEQAPKTGTEEAEKEGGVSE